MREGGYSDIVFHWARNGIPHWLSGFQKGSFACQKLSRWKYATGKLNIPKSRKMKVLFPRKTVGKVANTSNPRRSTNRPGLNQRPEFSAAAGEQGRAVSVLSTSEGIIPGLLRGALVP